MLIHYMDTFIKCYKEFLPAMFTVNSDFIEASKDYISTKASYTPLNNLTVQIPFYGSIIGDYFISVDKDKWQSLVNKSISIEDPDIAKASLKEFLNTICGEAICTALDDYPNLTYLSPRLLQGELDFPAIERISTAIHSPDLGKVELTICIDKMNLDINNTIDDILNDIKNKDKLLIHSDRLATLGTMAASLMHEISNPVSFISGNVQILQDYYLPTLQTFISQQNLPKDDKLLFINEELPKICNSMMNGVSRIKNLSHKLKGFSRKSDLKPSCININQCISTAVTFTESSLPPNVKISLELSKKMTTFYADEQQIEQVLINLISNAAHALENDTQAEIIISTSLDNLEISCSIKDNGPGIDPTLAEKIWNPFFTTKEKGKGTGLGLAICKEIINQSLGSIQLVENSDKGSEFLISFPIKEA